MKLLGYLFFFLCLQQLTLYALTPISTNGFVNQTPLSPPGPNAAPQIAVSENGQAMAVWVNFPNQIEIVGKFFDGTNWIPLVASDGTLLVETSIPTSTETPQTLLPIAFGSAPKLAIDGSGNATLVWVSPFNQIVVARFTKNIMDAGYPLQISAGGASNISPAIAMNDIGTTLIVWIQNIPFQVLFSEFFPIPGGFVWSTPAIFLSTSLLSNGTYPAQFGIGDNNLGTAIWLDAPTGKIYAESFTLP